MSDAKFYPKITPLTQRLREEDRVALLDHFIALEAEDRRLRFGAPIADEAIAAYVARIDIDRDGLFGVQDAALRWIGVAHVALGAGAAELGLSVAAGARNRGAGGALFARAVAYLRNRGVAEVFVHCLSENEAMLHLARRHRMRISSDGTESEARLRLPPSDSRTVFHEWLHDHQAAALRSLREYLAWARTIRRERPI